MADECARPACDWGSRGRRSGSCQPDSGKPQVRGGSTSFGGPPPTCGFPLSGWQESDPRPPYPPSHAGRAHSSAIALFLYLSGF